MKLGYGRQWIDDDDIEEIVEVFRSDFISQGPKIKEFEKALCDYTGAKYCTAVSSGTAALHLAVSALDLPKGSEGITSAMTFIATANSMIYSGIEPVLCDIDPGSFLMDLGLLSEKINEKTGLIIPVHFAGLPCDMVEVEKIAGAGNNERIHVIEDAAHALGSKYPDGKKVGCCSHSDMTVFSFHPVKAITTGEGGAVTTNDENLFEKLISLRNHGFMKNASGHNEMRSLGFNYRMTDFQAAMGKSQLKKIDRFVERRRQIAECYISRLSDLQFISFQKVTAGSDSSWHIMVMLVDFERAGIDKNEFISDLRNEGIFTQVHYLPVHLHEYYRKNFGFKTGDFPVSEEYFLKALTIPLYPKMTDWEIEFVAGEIIKKNKQGKSIS